MTPSFPAGASRPPASAFLLVDVTRTEHSPNGEIYEHCIVAGFHAGLGQHVAETDSPYVDCDTKLPTLAQDLVEYEAPPPPGLPIVSLADIEQLLMTKGHDDDDA